MSVINTMLKDLENRGGSAADEEVLRGLSSAPHADVAQPANNNYHLVGALGVLIVLLVMVIVYLLSPYHLVVMSRIDQVLAPVEIPVQPQVQPQARTVAEAAPVVEENTPVRPVAKAIVEKPVVEKTEVVDVAKLAEVIEVKPAANIAVQAEKVEPVAEAQPVVAAIDEEAGGEHEISRTQLEPTREEKSQDAYLRALSMYNRGRVQESKSLLKDALNYDVYNLDARKLLASLYLREERAGVAVAVIEKGLSNYSANQELLRLYLQAQVQLQNYADAITIMEQRLRLTTPEDIAYLAGLYQKNDGHQNAVRLYSQALQMKPSRSVWWMGQAISFEALGQQEEALRAYQQSIASGQLSAQLSGYVKNRIGLIEHGQLKSTS